ncbi:nitroreductase family protein [Caldisericum exile]|nr:hypothetical protein [Caldisericum exile]
MEEIGKEAFLKNFLEETFIPYDNSVEMRGDNLTSFLRRFEKNLLFEMYQIKSYLSKYDPDNYDEKIKENYEIKKWFFNTAYSYRRNILDEKQRLIVNFNNEGFKSIFNELLKGKNVQNIFFSNDVYLLFMSKLYRYIPKHNEFLYLRAINTNEILKNVISEEKKLDEFKVIILIISSPLRNYVSFGERGYRNCIFEAGLLSQKLSDICESLKFEYLNIYNFYDKELNNLIGLDGVDHYLQNMIFIKPQALGGLYGR